MRSPVDMSPSCKAFGDVEQVDDLMRRLYAQSKGKLHQILIADFSIADRQRHVLDPSYPVSRRPIVRATDWSWKYLSRTIGFAASLRINAVVWVLLGLPSLLVHSLRLHADGYTREGPSHASVILLRTGVANEPRIADWLSRKHGVPVIMLLLNPSAKHRWSSLRYIPRLINAHFAVCIGAIRDMLALLKKGALSREELDIVVPAWMVLLARRSASISWSYVWAKTQFATCQPEYLYFTMNYAYESGFAHGLRSARPAYVEHGFPRRDIPPLECKQYVYGQRYADYLRSFDASIDIEEIGLAYFPKRLIVHKEPVIVVASLQDWPQWGLARVEKCFNTALGMAKSNGWKIVLRGRNYDGDSFLKGLKCDWDEISEPEQESFSGCLSRLKPKMVWTTWSTALLDSEAMGIPSIAFLDNAIYDFFLPHFGQITTIIYEESDLSRVPL